MVSPLTASPLMANPTAPALPPSPAASAMPQQAIMFGNADSVHFGANRRRAGIFAAAMAALALGVSACGGGAESEPVSTNPPVSTTTPSPAPTEEPATEPAPEPTRPETACGFEGQDLEEYTANAEAFKGYFGDLVTVLQMDYGASSRDAQALNESAAVIIERLESGDVGTREDEANLLTAAADFQAQLAAFFEANPEPTRTGAATPQTITVSVERISGLLGQVMDDCNDNLDALNAEGPASTPATDDPAVTTEG